MNRRNFLTSMLAACAAPAIVCADSLMRIVATDVAVIPVEYGSQRLSPFIVLDSNPVGTNSWMARYYGDQIRRMSRELADAIDRDILESLTGKRLTTEFKAPKFPLVGQSARPQET